MTTNADAIRVLLVDDQELFRRGVTMVLGADGGFEIEDVDDGDAALERIAEEPFDVVLLDVRMPGRSGVEICGAIKETAPTTGIIMLTASDDEADLYESIKAGAAGYLLKDGSTYDQVAEAVKLVAAGQSLISPSMATKLLDEFVHMAKGPAPATSLTARELQVLRLVAHGKSNRDIAGELFISENTVKNHIRNILEKLQMKSRMEAAMYAVRSKLIDDVL
ncbi:MULTISPECIES: response regulator [Aeromicrobium]|uniref:Two-component system NarL family response regulator n=2 Tax=Aeromicrobium TaxID=2040 RepID=A0ABX2SGE2_9ACTN|nr:MULTISPECIES: response regulator transcription factor [Aeromicrobium]NYI37221.1 two-component system NarL family response regulator [Aeromicrobium tamlense]SKB04387.1 two component transcriptional regulator, LuxR family [Aeromicrobium choanae]